MDTAKHQLVLQGQPLSVHLSPQELDLLHGIWEKRGKVCTFAEICDRLWPDEESHSGRQDDVHQVIRQVRKKLETVLDTEVIENVPRVGYRFGG